MPPNVPRETGSAVGAIISSRPASVRSNTATFARVNSVRQGSTSSTPPRRSLSFSATILNSESNVELPNWQQQNGTQRVSENVRISRYQEPTIFSSLACYGRRSVSVVFTFSFLGSLMTAAIMLDVWNRMRSGVLKLVGSKSAPGPRPFASIERERALKRTRQDKKVVRDINYYASLVGLRAIEYEVVTKDQFVLQLYRIVNPDEPEDVKSNRYPVLLMHGLLQSAGAFCVNDDDSLAFYLCKSGFDVWLGNNRCGFDYKHLKYKYNDPRMWEWDVRDMGTKDLPAFIDFILQKTNHSKLGLVAHSQGTTETFLALSKFHAPEIGDKISGFCALAPAIYAGPLVDRDFFKNKYMRFLPKWAYRLLFGIHAFIPSMLAIRNAIPKSALAYCSYAMFHFLFRWSDERWDRFLEARMFQFSPVYISAESMYWWLGKEGFATRRCVFESETQEPWFDSRCPPLALWIAEADSLVDGKRLAERLKMFEPAVVVVNKKVIPTYEHLDVLWAVDAVDRVGRGVKEVLWMTAHDRSKFRCPTECEEL